MDGQPWAPSLLVFLIYGVWLLAMLHSGRDARDFIHMGRRFVFVPGAPSLFRPDPTYTYATKTNGYDGQFAFYIAVSPVGARLHLDRSNYRYTRIVYPMAARLLSLGNAAIIPYVLIAINWLAIAAGTYVVSLWLRRRSISIWLALAYGLSPGLFICLQRDLEEPLAYGFVALALFLYSSGANRTRYAGIVFGLAALTRESTAVFPVVLALVSGCTALSSDRYSKRALGRATVELLAPALLPLLIYKMFLLYWLSPDAAMAPIALLPRVIPFSGLFAYWPWRNHQVEEIIGVVTPSLICGSMGVWALRKRHTSPEIWLLLANVVLFVVMLNKLSYENIFASGRIATGVVLTALWSIPAIDRLTGRDRLWLSLSALLWFLPWPVLAPFIDRTPLTRALEVELLIAMILWSLVEVGVRSRRGPVLVRGILRRAWREHRENARLDSQ